MTESIIISGTLLTLLLLMFTVGGVTIFAGIKAKIAVPVHAKVLSVRSTAQNAATVTFEFDDGNRASLTVNGCTLMEGETSMLRYFGGIYHSFHKDTVC